MLCDCGTLDGIIKLTTYLTDQGRLCDALNCTTSVTGMQMVFRLNENTWPKVLMSFSWGFTGIFFTRYFTKAILSFSWAPSSFLEAFLFQEEQILHAWTDVQGTALSSLYSLLWWMRWEECLHNHLPGRRRWYLVHLACVNGICYVAGTLHATSSLLLNCSLPTILMSPDAKLML